jgi:uncharacterized protein YjbI with pentapeptide repeats
MAQTPINDRDVRFRDGLGIRVGTTDASGDAVEQLRLVTDLANQESAIRERVGRLVNFRHVKYVRLRGVDRLKQGGKELVVSCDAVEGDRLSTILERTSKIPLTLEVDVALQIVRDLLPGIGILHDSRKVTHGAIAPERLIYTALHRLIILDHGFGLALGKLNQPRRKLWDHYRIAVPGSSRSVFDERTDVVQIGLVALAALLARPLADDEYPGQLKRLILSVKEHSSKHGVRPISPELRQWLERALPVDEEHPYRTVRDAQEAFETLVTKGRYAPSAAAVKAFLTRYREAAAAAALAAAAPEPRVEMSSAAVDRAMEEFAITIGPKTPISRSKAKPADETPVPRIVVNHPPVVVEPVPADAARTLMIASAIEGHQAPSAATPIAEAPKTRTTRKSDRLSESPLARERVGDAARRARQTSLRSDVTRPETLPTDAAGDAGAGANAGDAPRRTRGRLDALRALEEELSRLAALDLVMPRHQSTPPVTEAAVLEATVAEATLVDAAPVLAAPIEAAPTAAAFVETASVETASVEATGVAIAAVDATLVADAPFEIAAVEAVAVEAAAVEAAAGDIAAIEIAASEINAVAPAIEPIVDAVSIETVSVEALPQAVATKSRRPFMTDAIDAELARLMGDRDPDECATPVWTIDQAEAPLALEPAIVQPTVIEPAALEVAVIEPVVVEPPVLEVAAVEPAAVELAVVADGPTALDVVATPIEDTPAPVAFETPVVEEPVAFEPAAVEATSPVVEPTFELTPPSADMSVMLASFELTAPVAEASAVVEHPGLLDLTAFDQFAADIYAAAELARQHTRLFDAEPEAIEAAAPGVESAIVAPPVVEPVLLEAVAAIDAHVEVAPAPVAESLTADAPAIDVAAAEVTVEAAVVFEPVADLPIEQPPVAFTPVEDVAPAAETTTAESVVEPAPAARARPRFRSAFGRVRQLFQRVDEQVPDQQAAEAARLEAERVEAARLEAERLDAARLEAERLEAERIEAARVEAERLEAERLEAERLEAERLEAERLDAERLEAARLEAARIEAARIEADRVEAVRLEAARLEAERLEAERLEAARREAERLEAERLEAARLEAARLEAERVEAARVEAARLEAARLEAERLEAERIEAARVEAERLEAERLEAARREAERLEAERLEAARLEAARIEAARIEAERVEAARLEAARLEAARLEAARVEAERLEVARLEALRSEAVAFVAAPAAPARESRSQRKRSRRRNKRRGEPTIAIQTAAQPVEVKGVEMAPVEITAAAEMPAPVDVPSAAPAAGLAATDGEAVDRVAFFEFDASLVADAVPAWARGASTAPPVESDEPMPQGIGTVQFEAGQVELEPMHAATSRPAWEAQANAFQPTSNVIPFQPQVEQRTATTDQAAATMPARPRRQPLLFRIDWGRTLAASLVLALLEGVAFAAAWWYVTPTELGWLVVHTRPAGIEISVDGMARGQTPFALSLKPGRHTIELRQGTATRVVPVEISAGVQTEQRITWGKAFKTGQARITSTPDGARVLIDGKSYGRTPLTVSELSAGKHAVTVDTASGSVTSSLIVEAGETTVLDVPVYSGWVSILSPVELEIFESGRLIGTTEAEKIMLAPGRYKLVLKSASLGYEGTQAVEVRPGATTAVSVLPKGEVTIEGPKGTEVFIDGDRVGELPMATLKAPIGTREFVFKHPEQGERHVVVVVTMSAPVAVKYPASRE